MPLDQTELLDRVTRRYDTDEGLTGLPHPAWPDPHPEPGVVADDEYSRLTDPVRYRIVRDRIRAWVQVLAETDGVDVVSLSVESLGSAPEAGAPLIIGWRLACDRPGTAPLFVLEYDLPDAELVARETVPSVALLAGRPDSMPLEVFPGCGCDACDDGSRPLLDAVDDAVLTLVTGPVVVLRHPDWAASTTARSSGAFSLTAEAIAPPLDAVEAWCRSALLGDVTRLPQRTEVVAAGSPWGIVR